MLAYVDNISGFQTNFSKHKEKQYPSCQLFIVYLRILRQNQEIQDKCPKKLTTQHYHFIKKGHYSIRKGEIRIVRRNKKIPTRTTMTGKAT